MLLILSSVCVDIVRLMYTKIFSLGSNGVASHNKCSNTEHSFSG